MARDSFSFGGAHLLASRIKKFWRALGRSIEIRVEALPSRTVNDPTLWVVRSNMLNGLPRKVTT